MLIDQGTDGGETHIFSWIFFVECKNQIRKSEFGGIIFRIFVTMMFDKLYLICNKLGFNLHFTSVKD